MRFSSNKREKFVILTPKKSEKRSVNVENLFSDFEWYFASVRIDLSSSRDRHVCFVRLWLCSLVTTDHSNIVSFYNNFLLLKRSLFNSWGWGWMFNDFNIDYRLMIIKFFFSNSMLFSSSLFDDWKMKCKTIREKH